MKKPNTKIFLWALLITTFLSVSTESHAQVFGVNLSDKLGSAKDIFKGAKEAAAKALEEANKAIEEASKKRAEDQRKKAEEARLEALSRITDNSLILLQGNVGSDIRWVMFSITKGSFNEVVTVPVVEGQYKARLALRDGAGIYDIQIFQNNKPERYTSYSHLKNTQIENKDERDMSFLLPSDEVQLEDERIISLTKKVTSNAKDDVEAIKAIHDYIAKNVDYDYPSYNDGSFVKKKHDALYVLENRVAVCEGYSNLFAAMVRSYGIRTKVIHGKGIVKGALENHAWNEVEIEGEWKSIDVTWGSNLKSNKYFVMDEETFAQDHLKEKELLER